MKKQKALRLLKAINSYVVFFLVVSFAVTCCMMLFVSTLADRLHITLTEANTTAAAKMAAYTFYSTVCAVIELVRSRKHQSPVMTASTVISLAAALVSMLALETAMFSQFGAEMSVEDQRLMIALTGAGVSITVIVLSVCIIIRRRKRSRRERKMEENNKTFRYTYSAQQQEEIERIRRKYMPPEEDKMTQLRRLDRRATQIAQAWAIAVGVIGALVMGTGMSLMMTELSDFLGGNAMYIGIPVALVGMVLTALAYPVYSRVIEKERQRIAPEVLRLTDELLQ